MKTKIFITFISVFLVCFLIFGGILYVFTRENLIGADVPKTDEPYDGSPFIPEDTTVLFSFPDGYSAVINLEFSKKFVSAVIIKGNSYKTAENYGFYPLHTAICDYPFLMDFIDILGGIELTTDDTVNRYTGVQICNMLASFKEDMALRVKVLEAVFIKISKSGLSTEALYCIIEDTDSSLSVPTCYGWCENVSEACSSFNIINER